MVSCRALVCAGHTPTSGERRAWRPSRVSDRAPEYTRPLQDKKSAEDNGYERNKLPVRGSGEAQRLAGYLLRKIPAVLSGIILACSGDADQPSHIRR
jgi:hypothetical protein